PRTLMGFRTFVPRTRPPRLTQAQLQRRHPSNLSSVNVAPRHSEGHSYCRMGSRFGPPNDLESQPGFPVGPPSGVDERRVDGCCCTLPSRGGQRLSRGSPRTSRGGQRVSRGSPLRPIWQSWVAGRNVTLERFLEGG